MQKLKMLQVEPETHKLAKQMAAKRGKSIKAYIKQLVEEDSKK